MESSWLSSALPKSSGPPSPDEHHKVRWRTPSPMRDSMIPPPIVNSIYIQPSQSSTHRHVGVDHRQSFWIQQKQRQLEDHLQVLLDAQAEGLLTGSEGVPQEDDGVSTGSSTPTVRSMNLNARDRTRQRRRKIGLQDARRHIQRTMRMLALLQVEELRQLEPDFEECSATLEQIETWERKRKGLRKRTDGIQSGDEHQQAEALRHRANTMQAEIDELEDRLLNLKRTQKKLHREAEDIENRVQAKLSPYTSSLTMLERDIQRFLSEATPTQASHTMDDQAVEFWQFPTKRRTLEMAKETWTKEKETLLQKQDFADAGREALEEGAVVWSDVVKEVSDFESRIREDMLQQPDVLGCDEPNPMAFRLSTMKRILERMDQVLPQLESKYKLAETRGWKLLICAIGAELEAMRKGRRFLAADIASAEGSSGGDTGQSNGHDSDIDLAGLNVASKDSHGDNTHSDGDGGIEQLDHAFQTQESASNNGARDIDTSEDDGPDPELLISHQDTDTD